MNSEFLYTLKDLIKGLVKTLIPFNKDREITKKLYDICEEVEKFIIFSNKGPSKLEKIRIKGVLFETHIEFVFASSDANKKNRICFINNASENNISFGMGGNSAIGFSYRRKDNINYEDIAKDVYRFVEISGKNNVDNNEELCNWKKEFIEPILEKYGLENDFYYIRRALILETHEKNELKYILAKEQLINRLSDEKEVMNFVEEINNAYTAKIVIDRLM